jgi:hypothetical protein
MSNSSGLAWSAAKGTIAALRLVDDIRGAGEGFRLLRSTAAVSSGARGRRTRTGRSVHWGWVRGAHRDGDWPGRRERQPDAGQRRSAADDRDSARPPGSALRPPRLFLPQVFRRTSPYGPFLVKVPGAAVSSATSKR